MNKNLLKWPNIIRYFARMLFDIRFDFHFDLKSLLFCFRLLFNLGYRGLLLALTANLEAGPRFAGI